MEEWGRIVHYSNKYRYNINIYLTTNISNRRINKELNKITYKRIIEIFPFSYKESLEYYKLNSKEKLKLNEEELFEEYQQYGGLLEVLETDNLSYKKTIINWAYENTMYPQIYKLYFRDFEENLIKYLIEETGHIFPERIIQKFINQDYSPYFNIYNLSLEVLEEYLSIATSINIIKNM